MEHLSCLISELHMNVELYIYEHVYRYKNAMQIAKNSTRKAMKSSSKGRVIFRKGKNRRYSSVGIPSPAAARI